jgi:hypothetical protein
MQNASPAPSGAGFVLTPLFQHLGRAAVICLSHIFGVLHRSMYFAFDVTLISSSGQNVIQIS